MCDMQAYTLSAIFIINYTYDGTGLHQQQQLGIYAKNASTCKINTFLHTEPFRKYRNSALKPLCALERLLNDKNNRQTGMMCSRTR